MRQKSTVCFRPLKVEQFYKSQNPVCCCIAGFLGKPKCSILIKSEFPCKIFLMSERLKKMFQNKIKTEQKVLLSKYILLICTNLQINICKLFQIFPLLNERNLTFLLNVIIIRGKKLESYCLTVAYFIFTYTVEEHCWGNSGYLQVPI